MRSKWIIGEISADPVVKRIAESEEPKKRPLEEFNHGEKEA